MRSGQRRAPKILETELDVVIHEIRGQRVILDSDLARIYGVPTFRFNEAIKRNKNRFPADFIFKLTHIEFDSLTSQFAMSKPGRGGRRTLPYAFTEHGALQAANILNSARAVQMSVLESPAVASHPLRVIRAFVKMRETLLGTRELARKLQELEKKLTGRLDNHEVAIVHVLQEIMRIINPPPSPPAPPRPRIGFQQP